MEKVYFGIKKSTKERIYLDTPTWDCEWYWSFGYLGNRSCHYHLEDYQYIDRSEKLENGFLNITEKRNINMRDALLEDYDLNPVIKNNLWEFCELAISAYTLKKSAELFERCGSNMCRSTNEVVEALKDERIVKRINEVSLPAVFKRLEEIYNTKL